MSAKGRLWQGKLTVASGVKVRAPLSSPTWMSMTLAETVEARTKPMKGMNMAGKFVRALGNKINSENARDQELKL